MNKYLGVFFKIIGFLSYIMTIGCLVGASFWMAIIGFLIGSLCFWQAGYYLFPNIMFLQPDGAALCVELGFPASNTQIILKLYEKYKFPLGTKIKLYSDPASKVYLINKYRIKTTTTIREVDFL